MEDRRACKQLGATARHFTWKDAPYRKDRNGAFMYETGQCDQWHDADNGLVSTISSRLSNALRVSDVLLAPMGIGRHVDHLITRHVAANLEAPLVMYYPEVPYLQLFPNQLSRAISGLCPVNYSLQRDEIVTWIGSLESYVSQMGMLERAAGHVPDLIEKYASGPLALYRRGDREPSDLTPYRVFG